MKNIVLTIVFSFAFIFFVNAQGPHHHKNYEQLKAQKIAFITEKLQLTPEEAQQFWPVFNEYEKKQQEIMESRRGINKQCRNTEVELSDKELSEMADKYVQSNLDEAKLLEEYHAKFKKILSPKKVLMLYHTENEFKRHLLNQIRGGGNGHGYGRGANQNVEE